MHIRIDEQHLQVGPVTVDLSRQHLLSLICRLAAPYVRHDDAEDSDRPDGTSTQTQKH